MMEANILKKRILIFLSLTLIFSVLTGCSKNNKETTNINSSRNSSDKFSTIESTELVKTVETTESSINNSALTADDFLGKAYSGTAKEGEKEYPFEIAFGVKNVNNDNIKGDLLYMKVGQMEGNFDIYDELTITNTDKGVHVSARYIDSDVGVDFEIVRGEDESYLLTVAGKECVIFYNDEMTHSMNTVDVKTSISSSDEAIKQAQAFMSADNENPNFIENYSFYDDSGVQTDEKGKKFYSIRVRQNGNGQVKSMAIGFINVDVQTGNCHWQ